VEEKDIMESQLNVECREVSGKGVNRKLQRAGFMPGILYGPTREPLMLTLDRHTTDKLITGGGSRKIIDLNVTGVKGKTEKFQVMFKDIQRDALTRELIHIDFYEITRGQKITADIPVILKGDPIGVEEEGGALQFQLRELKIQCLPSDLPEFQEVDVSGLDIGESIAVKDLVVNPAVTLLDEPDRVVASVVVVKAAVLDEPEEEEEEAEEGEETEAEEESTESE
jgi:large subunit ribosomal protein L25